MRTRHTFGTNPVSSAKFPARELAFAIAVAAIFFTPSSHGQPPARPDTPGAAKNDAAPEAADFGELDATVIHSVQRLLDGDTLAVVCYALDVAEIVRIDSFGRVRWRFGEGLSWPHSAQFIPARNTVLITDTGHDRAIEIDREGTIVWRYAKPGLDYPNDADRLENGHTLLTVRDADLILEVDANGREVWHFSGVKGPHNADRLPNGHTLIANSLANRVVEIDGHGRRVWELAEGLRWPRDADRLADGHTLIADTGHARVVEVDANGREVWQFRPAPMVYDADRLPNGRTLLSMNSRDGSRIVEVDREGRIWWQWHAPLSPADRVGFHFREFPRPGRLVEAVLFGMHAAREHGASFADLAPVADRLARARQALALNRQSLWQSEFLAARDALAHLNWQLAHRRARGDSADLAPMIRGSIRGRIADPSGQPIAGAEVMVVGTRFATTSNAAGEFTIDDIPIRTPDYALAVRKAGYEWAVIGGWSPNANGGDDAPLNVGLHPLGEFGGEAAGTRLGDDAARVLTWRAAVMMELPAAVKPPEQPVVPVPIVPAPNWPATVREFGGVPDGDASALLGSKMAAAMRDCVTPEDSAATARAIVALVRARIAVDSPEQFPHDVTGLGWRMKFGECSRGPGASRRTLETIATVGRATPRELAEFAVAWLRIAGIPARAAVAICDAGLVPVVEWYAVRGAGAADDGDWRALSLTADADSGTLRVIGPAGCAGFEWAGPSPMLWRLESARVALFSADDGGRHAANVALDGVRNSGWLAVPHAAENPVSAATAGYAVIGVGGALAVGMLSDDAKLALAWQWPTDSPAVRVLDRAVFISPVMRQVELADREGRVEIFVFRR